MPKKLQNEENKYIEHSEHTHMFSWTQIYTNKVRQLKIKIWLHYICVLLQMLI